MKCKRALCGSESDSIVIFEAVGGGCIFVNLRNERCRFIPYPAAAQKFMPYTVFEPAEGLSENLIDRAKSLANQALSEDQRNIDYIESVGGYSKWKKILQQYDGERS